MPFGSEKHYVARKAMIWIKSWIMAERPWRSGGALTEGLLWVLAVRKLWSCFPK
jgi:hypothetical protein